MKITIKQLEHLRIHAGAARGAIGLLAIDVRSNRFRSDLATDAVRNLNNLLLVVSDIELAENTENDQNAVNY